MYEAISWVGGLGKRRPVSECVLWVAEGGWGRGIACVGGA